MPERLTTGIHIVSQHQIYTSNNEQNIPKRKQGRGFTSVPAFDAMYRVCLKQTLEVSYELFYRHGAFVSFALDPNRHGVRFHFLFTHN